MTTTRVGDTDIYVEYWSPQERTRSDDVADMLRRLRVRIAALREDTMAKKDTETRSAPIAPLLDKLIVDVHAEDMKDREDYEPLREWIDKHVI